MIKFEKVSRFADADFPLPIRKTKQSAGYDFVVAEDIIVPSYLGHVDKIGNSIEFYDKKTVTIEELKSLNKSKNTKLTLVSTGVKCYLEPGTYLELSVRSSTPLNTWLMLANGVGIIDADYADNEDNEGEIFFQLINFSPFDIQLKKGDIIGQGIIKEYLTTDDDKASGKRTGGFGSTSKPFAGAGLRKSIFPVDEYIDIQTTGGHKSEANGQYSFAFGSEAKTNSAGSISFGNKEIFNVPTENNNIDIKLNFSDVAQAGMTMEEAVDNLKKAFQNLKWNLNQ